MTDFVFCETCGHNHCEGECIGAAGMLRRHLLRHHNTDYGLTDEQLAEFADEARAYVGGRRWSWTTIAASWIRAAAEPRLWRRAD